MRRPAVAVCALLTVCSCTAPQPVQDGDAGAPAQAAPVRTEANGGSPGTAPTSVLEFGTDHRFDSGLVVTVSDPASFRPSENAYPPALRAAAFTVVVHNGTASAYRLSHLGVHATVSGQAAKQLMDPAQGYHGVADADRDIPSGETVEVSYAFAVPTESSRLRLTVQPDTRADPEVRYGGAV